MKDHIRPVRRGRVASRSVGVRELKTHAARIVRQVRESRASYVLTHRGRAVGVILPLDVPEHAAPSAEDARVDAAWDAFLRAGRRVHERSRSGRDGVRLLSSMRR